MGCTNCNGNNSEEINSNKLKSLGELAANDYEGHFFLKVITFLLLLIGLPLILLVLIFQIFGTFFLPNSLGSIKNSIGEWAQNKVKSYGERARDKELLKRKKQFSGNSTYNEVEIYDIETNGDLQNNKNGDEN